MYTLQFQIKGVTWWTRLRGSNDQEESTPEGEKEMEEKGMDREKRKKETTAGKEGCEDGMVGLVDGQNNIDAGGFILILMFSF